MNRVVIVICDSLRADLIIARDAPFLTELGQRSARFAAHSSVFPSTTRTIAASIATGCLPARHGLLGNTMALDEGEGLVCLSVGKPDFRDRLHRATGRTLHVPTLAERVSGSGETAIAIAVSPLPLTRSARVGTCKVRPVARCSRSRKSGLPTERQTSPSPSSSAIVLPRSPCRAGRHPVAIEAALVRVVDGNTLAWLAKRAERSPS